MPPADIAWQGKLACIAVHISDPVSQPPLMSVLMDVDFHPPAPRWDITSFRYVAFIRQGFTSQDIISALRLRNYCMPPDLAFFGRTAEDCGQTFQSRSRLSQVHICRLQYRLRIRHMTTLKPGPLLRLVTWVLLPVGLTCLIRFWMRISWKLYRMMDHCWNQWMMNRMFPCSKSGCAQEATSRQSACLRVETLPWPAVIVKSKPVWSIGCCGS